jgi:hypothetical protein
MYQLSNLYLDDLDFDAFTEAKQTGLPAYVFVFAGHTDSLL